MASSFGSDFNWTSGFDTFRYSSATPYCSSSVGLGSTIPPANSSNSNGLIPRAIIPGASIVTNITKVDNFSGNITIAPCRASGASMFPTDSTAWTPVVGQLTVISGQCVEITVQVDPANCSTNNLEIESALIGDFCARSPTADVCKDHNPKVTVPPAVRASLGGDTSVDTNNSTGSANTMTTAPSNGKASTTTTPSAEPKSAGSRHSAHHVVMASLVACVAAAMASL